MNAPICYVEIPAPNVEMASKFYQRVFEWKVTNSPMDGEPYAMFETGDGLCGGFDSAREPSVDGNVFYIKVNDINESLNKVKNYGGVVVSEKSEIGNGYGFYGMFLDPNGNKMGLWSKK